MFRFTAILMIIVIIVIGISCKKKTEEKPEVSGAKFNESFGIAMGHFKNLYEPVVIKEDVLLGANEADKLSKQWSNIIKDFSSNPPAKYADKEEWKIWLFDMEGIIKKLNEAINRSDLDGAKNLCYEFMKNVIHLNETTGNLSTKDEIMRFEILAGEMLSALKSGSGDEMKRTLVKMERVQDKLYTSAYPDTAKGREAEFDKMKNDLYDALNDFKFSTSQDREDKLKALIEISHEMFLDFG
ncbi:MAG: hypothetical protein ACUVWP_06435 [bacterium]